MDITIRILTQALPICAAGADCSYFSRRACFAKRCENQKPNACEINEMLARKAFSGDPVCLRELLPSRWLAYSSGL